MIPDECAGANYCTALPNSSGGAASISLTGTTVVANNDFGLRAESCPARRTGGGRVSQHRAEAFRCVARALDRITGLQRSPSLKDGRRPRRI